MKNRLMCLSMALVMALGLSATVHAEEQTEASWTVSFNGTELVDDAADNHVLQNNIVLPGDTVMMTTTVKNDFDKDTNWYIETTGIKTLLDKEDSFEYELTYNGNVIFASDTLGSAETGGDSDGLSDIDMDGFEWLTTLKPNETGTVKLVLKVDPEVQGNTYWETIAELAEVYAVEIVEPTVVEREIIKTVTKKKVITGDNSNLGLAWAAMVGGIACIAILFVVKKKEEA